MSTGQQFRLSNLDIDFVSLVAAGDDPLAQVVIAKAAPNDSSEENMGNISKDDLDPEVVAYIAGLEDEVDTLSAQVTKSETDLTAKDAEIADLTETITKSVPKDAASAEEITKSLLAKADPAVRALIEKQNADLAAVHEIAKAERTARLDREFISKAEAMPMLTEDKTALAGLLLRASQALTPEDNTALDVVLKAANAQIAAGNLFANFGKGGGETTISKSVKAAGEAIRKADPTLTVEQAEAKAYEANPELLAQAMTGEDA